MKSRLDMNWRENIFIYGLLFLLGIMWLLPLIYLVVYSLQDGGWANYHAVLSLNLFPRFIINSVIISFFVLLFLITSVALAAFAFSKMHFPCKNILFNLALVGLMLPQAALLVPVFQTIKFFGWINSYQSLIGPEVALFIPFSLLITRNLFDDIPNELLEAAQIDGSNSWGQFFHIILPLGVPILTTVAIFGFLHSWNEYLLPLAFINDKNMLTVTMAPKFFVEAFTADYNKVFAAMVLISIPILLLYLFGQKYLQKGLMSGAIK